MNPKKEPLWSLRVVVGPGPPQKKSMELSSHHLAFGDSMVPLKCPTTPAKWEILHGQKTGSSSTW